MKKGLIAVLSMIFGAGIGYAGNKIIEGNEKEILNSKVTKFKNYYNVLNQWLIVKQENKSFESYFIKNGYKKIAIYGMGELGKRFVDELMNTEVEIKYAIDKNAVSIYSDLDVFEMDDDLEPVDAIVVTATFAFDEVKNELKKRVDCPIISLEKIFCDL